MTELKRSVIAKVDQLTDEFEARYLGRELEIGVSFTAMMLDVITDYCFGQSWQCLAAPNSALG